jgi:iron complex outermembrane receptor protein
MVSQRAYSRRLRSPDKKRIASRALIAMSIATVYAAPVSAAVGDGTDIIETVFVTARRQTEDVQKVPLPVTVLTGQALSDSNDTQIQQLPLKVPGLTVTGSNSRQIVFALRGLGNNPTSDGLSSSVGVYMDGVYLDRPGMAAFDLLDIAQVEVLRGPQGTLFGKNTTAGAITITTLAPEFDYSAAGTVRVGNLGFHQAHLSVTGPISDVLAFRLSGYDTDRNGYLNDIYDGGHLLSLHRKGLRGQLLYRPSATFLWRIIAEYGRQQDSSGSAVTYSAGPAQSANPTFVSFGTWARNLGIAPILDPTLLENSVNSQQKITERQYSLTSLVTWQLGSMTMDSVTGWRDWRYEPHIDGDYTSADVIENNGAVNLDRQLSEELRLSGTISAINYVLGGYFFSRDIWGDSFTHFGSQYSQGLGAIGNASLNNGTSHTYVDIANQSYAAFLQGTWHFLPQWNLTAGLRETYETESGTITRGAFAGGSGPAPPTFAAYNGNFSTREWTPSALLSVDYAVGDSLLIYGISSYGAKAGGFNPTVPPVSGGTFLPIETLKVKPEQTADLELGVKSELLDHHIILNLNGYWESVIDYQTSALQLLPNSERKQNITNVGSVRSQGVEVDLTARILSGIQLTSSLSYNDAHYVTFTNGPPVEGSTALTQDLSRRPLLLAPAWAFFAGLRYTRAFALGISGFIEGELALKSGYYGYVDDSFYSRVSSTSIGNLQLGLTIDRADVAVWIKNISDERTFAPVFPVPTGAGGYMANPGEPRTFGLTLRYSLE